MKKSLLIACALSTVTLPAFASIDAALNQAGEEAKEFYFKWKPAAEDGYKRIFDKKYKYCVNFTSRPSILPRQKNNLETLISQNGEAARPFFQPMFELYLTSYNSDNYNAAIYNLFEFPSQFNHLCTDKSFADDLFIGTEKLLGRKLTK